MDHGHNIQMYALTIDFSHAILWIDYIFFDTLSANKVLGCFNVEIGIMYNLQWEKVYKLPFITILFTCSVRPQATP